MANYDILKQSIKDVIKTNGNQEITGQLLQEVLINIVSSVGKYATFAGVITPAVSPGTIDGDVFFIASTTGTYSNFNNIHVTQPGLNIIHKNSGNWALVNVPITVPTTVTNKINALERAVSTETNAREQADADIQKQIDDILDLNSSTNIDNLREVLAFLDGISDNDTFIAKLDELNRKIALNGRAIEMINSKLNSVDTFRKLTLEEFNSDVLEHGPLYTHNKGTQLFAIYNNDAIIAVAEWYSEFSPENNECMGGAMRIRGYGLGINNYLISYTSSNLYTEVLIHDLGDGWDKPENVTLLAANNKLNNSVIPNYLTTVPVYDGFSSDYPNGQTLSASQVPDKIWYNYSSDVSLFEKNNQYYSAWEGHNEYSASTRVIKVGDDYFCAESAQLNKVFNFMADSSYSNGSDDNNTGNAITGFKNYNGVLIPVKNITFVTASQFDAKFRQLTKQGGYTQYGAFEDKSYLVNSGLIYINRNYDIKVHGIGGTKLAAVTFFDNNRQSLYISQVMYADDYATTAEDIIVNKADIPENAVYFVVSSSTSMYNDAPYYSNGLCEEDYKNALPTHEAAFNTFRAYFTQPLGVDANSGLIETMHLYNSGFIAINKSSRIRVKGFGDYYTAAIAFYDKDFKPISNIPYADTTTGAFESVTCQASDIPENAAYFVATSAYMVGASFEHPGKEPVSLAESTAKAIASKLDIADYKANNRQFSHDGVYVFVESGHHFYEDGSVISGYIKINKSADIKAHIYGCKGNAAAVALYDKYFNFIASVNYRIQDGIPGTQITGDDNAGYTYIIPASNIPNNAVFFIVGSTHGKEDLSFYYNGGTELEMASNFAAENAVRSIKFNGVGFFHSVTHNIDSNNGYINTSLVPANRNYPIRVLGGLGTTHVAAIALFDCNGAYITHKAYKSTGNPENIVYNTNEIPANTAFFMASSLASPNIKLYNGPTYEGDQNAIANSILANKGQFTIKGEYTEKTNGTFIKATNYSRTPYLPIDRNATVTVFSNIDIAVAVIAFYDANRKYISGITTTDTTLKNHVATPANIPANAVFMVLSAITNSVDGTTNYNRYYAISRNSEEARDGAMVDAIAEAKKALFIDEWNTAWSNGNLGKYDPANAPDSTHVFLGNDVWLTYEEAQVTMAWAWKGIDICAYDNVPNLRTNLFLTCPLNTFDRGYSPTRPLIRTDTLEVLRVSREEIYGLIFKVDRVSNYYNLIVSAKNLHSIVGVFNLNNFNRPLLINYAPKLTAIKLKNICAYVQIKDSPLLSLESVKYMADNAIDNSDNSVSNPISVAVHADVFAKLTGDTTNAAAAALTEEELAQWGDVMATMASKGIAFATA